MSSVWLLLVCQLLLQLARAIDRLARGEILQLEELAELDLAFRALAMGSRGALGPFDCFLLRLHLDQPISGDQPVGLGEGPLDHRALSPRREFEARALRARLKAREIEQDAGLR